ncbi:MAG: Sec-independent protein translocase subunit TatA [Pseudomonadales bacterium]|nr:Sec-independent protein translocase subunit TatA [Pseudomonadales bacterium]
MLGNLSIVHVLLLLIIVVMVFGTSRLKNVGRDLGSAINGFKQAMREGEQPSAPPPQENLAHQKPDASTTASIVKDTSRESGHTG